MKKIAFLLLFFSGFLSAQVGINTTSPSPASVLHLESLNGSGTHGGFMPPVVDQAGRDSINAAITAADDGMMIYYSDGTTRCVQFYNAQDGVWVDFYCMPIVVVPPASITQDFDLNTGWTYTSNVTYFQNGTDGYYDVTDGTELSALTLTDNFFGVRDLDDEGNGTTGEGVLTFSQVDVSGITGATFTFDYDSSGFNTTGDYFRYQIFHDGVGQGVVDLCTGCDDGSSGTVSVAIPDVITNFHVEIIVQCNGGSDYVGFDNFEIQ